MIKSMYYCGIVVFLAMLSVAVQAQTEAKRTGSVYLSTDAGQLWQKMDLGLPDGAIVNGFAVNGNFVIAGTETHGVFISDDQLQHWRASTAGLPEQVKVNSIDLLGSFIILGTHKHGIYLSKDKGRSWYASNTGLSNLDVRCSYVYEGMIYIGTERGLFKSVDSGQSWSQVFSELQVSGLTVMANKIYAGGDKGVVVSGDYGKTWKYILKDTPLHNVSNDGTCLYAMSYAQGVLRSKDGGANWENANEGLPEYYTFQVMPLGKSLLAGQWTGIFRSDNQGQYWTPFSIGFPPETSVKELVQTDFGLVAGTVKKITK